MSLNNILLSNTLLAELYPNVLVQGAATKKVAKTTVPFLGQNEQNILIVVNQKNDPFLPEKELAFLTTVLSACQLTLSEVALVNWTTVPEKSFAVLREQFSPKKALLLDVRAEEAGLPASEPYSVQTHQNLAVFCAPSLAEIEKTKQTKSRFWVALKELFYL